VRVVRRFHPGHLQPAKRDCAVPVPAAERPYIRGRGDCNSRRAFQSRVSIALPKPSRLVDLDPLAFVFPARLSESVPHVRLIHALLDRKKFSPHFATATVPHLLRVSASTPVADFQSSLRRFATTAFSSLPSLRAPRPASAHAGAEATDPKGVFQGGGCPSANPPLDADIAVSKIDGSGCLEIRLKVAG
jgi:hypothetical protein